MKLYRVWIVDKLTRIPVARCDVKAWTKFGAKRRIFKELCEKDTSYCLVAGIAPKE